MGFLELLYADAPRADFDRLVSEAEDRAGAAGLTAERLEALRREHELALRLREVIARHRAREAELTALYDTASDLTAIRDVDAILSAIVRRARQLLGADMTYLSLNDEEEGASYMKVTDGALTQEFRRLRLPLGTGLLGLVAQIGAPYFTEDYQADERFVHRGYIDEAVTGEHIRAILGVPLILDGRVIGALLAVHRTVRQFPAAEVSLLTSFAAHAAVALENARLFAQLDEAHATMTAHTLSVEAAATAHDRLTDLLLRGGGVAEVAEVLTGILDGDVTVHGPDGERLAGSTAPVAGWADAVADAVASGRSVPVDQGYVAPSLAGTEHLATLVLSRPRRPMGLAERRTLERGALVTGLVLLFARSVAETEERLGVELLGDLLDGRLDDPSRLRERARRQRLDLTDSAALCLAEVVDVDRHTALRAASVVVAGARGLAGEHEGRLVLIAPDADPAESGERLREAIARVGGSATVGVALVESGTDAASYSAGVREAYAEARRCLDTLLTLGRQGEVSDARGLGLARLLLGDNGPEELGSFLDVTIGPVREYDARRGTSLIATLEAWFATGGRLKAAAERLHVHPNTVTQRLDRIDDLLGDWREPGHSLDVQLALRVARLHAVRVSARD